MCIRWCVLNYNELRTVQCHSRRSGLNLVHATTCALSGRGGCCRQRWRPTAPERAPDGSGKGARLVSAEFTFCTACRDSGPSRPAIAVSLCTTRASETDRTSTRASHRSTSPSIHARVEAFTPRIGKNLRTCRRRQGYSLSRCAFETTPFL